MGNKGISGDNSIIYAEVVDCLINKNRELSAKEIYEKIAKNDYGDSERFTERSVYTYLENMVKKEHILDRIRVKGVNKYALNSDYFVVDGIADDRMQMILLYFLRQGRIKDYKNLRMALDREKDENYLLPNDDEELDIYLKSVRDDERKDLPNDKDVIRAINQAFEEDRLITFSYDGKKVSGDPLCYVVGRNTSQVYLFVYRKKQPMVYRLDRIEGVPEIGKISDLENQPEIIEDIRKQWDIDNKEQYVKVLLLDSEFSGDPEYKKAKQELDEYFLGSRKVDQGILYEGTMLGTTGFIPWVREHAEYCILLEPEDERKRIIESLEVRKERYS